MSITPVKGRVNLVVALSCEARPLIQRFKLRQASTVAGMRLYENQEGITLIVSGAGKQATAIACAYLAGLQDNPSMRRSAWFNIGVAGHRSLAIGEAALIHKVTDENSGRVYYPPMVLSAGCHTSSLITVEHPESDYEEDAAYDMEGSVFVGTAARFATAELVQLFKIISDNPLNPVETVNEQLISSWVQDQLAVIEPLASQLMELSAEYNRIYALPEEFLQLVKMARFSVSQRVQLEAGIRHYYALGGESLIDRLGQKSFRSAVEVLAGLQSLVREL